MSATLPKRLLALAALSLLSQAAAAWTTTGWFQGTLRFGDYTPINPETPYSPEALDGRGTTGSFTIEVDDAIAAGQPFDEFLQDLPGRMTVALTVGDLDLTFNSGAGGPYVGRWDTNSSGADLAFWTDYRPRFDGHILTFHSDDRSLLQGATPADYRLDGTTVDGIDLYFASSAMSAWFNVDVTSFGFGALAAPVPEPQAALLLAAGLAGVGGVVARQRRRAASAARSVPS